MTRYHPNFFLISCQISLLFLTASPAAGEKTLSLDYAREDFRTEIISSRRLRDRVVYDVTFPSPVKSPFESNDTVWGHLSVPKGRGPFATVLVLPVMAAPNVWIEERFMNRLIASGIAVFWIEMPYQFHRRPHPTIPSGSVFLARSPRRLAKNFQQAVLDARRALEWLSRHPLVDKDRIGLFGISLGAMVASSTYSVDPTPSYAVFMLGGADFANLLFGSEMTHAFLARAGLKYAPVHEAFKDIDPLRFEEDNAGKPALLINVRKDLIIPVANAKKLHQAFPASRQVWLPLGHYTAMVHILWTPFYVAREFKKNL